jgi:hypothetical protein
MFMPDGTFLGKWGSRGSGYGEFENPTGIAVDRDGYVYVSEWRNFRVQKFAGDGTFVTAWGALGTGDGEFYDPTGISVGADGTVFVAEWSNHRIQMFTSDGDFLGKFGSYGTGDGELRGPQDVEVDTTSGFVYVVDTNNDRIQKFTRDGVFLAKWGSPGSGSGQFDGASGIGLNTSGVSIYISDSYNHRVQKFVYGPTGARNTRTVPRLSVYPNPFSSSVTIEYELTIPSEVSLTIFDAKGRLVTALSPTQPTASKSYTTIWDGDNSAGAKVPTGIYFVRLEIGGEAHLKKIVFLK